MIVEVRIKSLNPGEVEVNFHPTSLSVTAKLSSGMGHSKSELHEMEGTCSDFYNFLYTRLAIGGEKQFLQSLSFLGTPRPELGASNVLTSGLNLEFSNSHFFIFIVTYKFFRQ